MTITVKSVNSILADMIRKVVLDSPITDVSEGSTIGTLLEAAALQDFQNQVAVLKVLESTNLQTLTGSDLDSKAREMNLPNGAGGVGRKPARRAAGNVTISSPFQKRASSLYIGKPAPFAGGTRLYLQDASGWPSVGSVYIGRGTNSEEGPVPYVSVQDNATFFTLELAPGSPLVKDHQYSDSVILAQGGDRQIPAGTIIRAPQPAGSPPLLFSVDSSFTILDGESSLSVPVSAIETGEDGNVTGGAISAFVNAPFSNAAVTNPLSFSSGASSEGDEELRSRIRDYIATLARGTRRAISSALLGLRDEDSGKTITSLNIVEPASIGEPAKIYIDDGTGFEPTVLGQGFEQLLVNASGQEVLFRTAHYPITPCTIAGTRDAPYSLSDGMYLEVEVDGIVDRFTVNQIEYTNLISVRPSELVRSFNSQQTLSGSQNIGFRTSNGGTRLVVTDLIGQAEKMRILPGELQEILGLPTDEIRPIFLYLNNELLTFKGSTAFLRTDDWPWTSLVEADLQNVGIAVDGVAQYFSINESDFSEFGASIATASLTDWVSVFKKKIAGVNITIAGSQLSFATWQQNSASGTVEVLALTSGNQPASWIGVNKLWSANQELYSEGTSSDFDINRVTGQIRLSSRPPVDSVLTVASENTRAEILSEVAPTGLFNVAPSAFGNAKMVVAADGDFEINPIALTGVASLTPTIVSVNQNLVKLDSSDLSLFATTSLNDFIYISPNSSVSNYMTSRLNSIYRVRQKGLNTRSESETFPNSTLEFDTPGPTSTEVTITLSDDHFAIPGKIIQLSATSLGTAIPALVAILDGFHTVTEVVNSSSFKISIPYTGSLPATPNTATVFLEADSYVVVEASKQEIDAFQGLFTDAPVQFSLLSSIISVQIPKHDLTGGFIQIDSLSPALASVFPGVVGIPGPKPITAIVDENTILVDIGSPAVGAPILGPITLDGAYTTTFSSFDIIEGMISSFTCEHATPFIVDFGTLPNQTADQLVESLSSAVGISAYKLSPRQIGLRSVSYDKSVTSLAILATTGTASNVFSTAIATGIQSHTAFAKSKLVFSGAPKFLSSVVPTNPVDFYPTRTSLAFSPTFTEILNDFKNPDIQASPSVLNYPVGLNEIGISGRGYDHYRRVYNNDIDAPFEGFARGENVIRTLPQSVPGTNLDESSLSVRLADIPMNFSDSLVIEMDLDEVNKTISVPMYKSALIQEMQVFGQGSGTQITFTLKDPDDEITVGNPRPFFETNSPYRNFDFTDFNILFKPTLIHTIYPTFPFSGNPSDALVIKSTQFGPAHELRFQLVLPTSPNDSVVAVTHTSFEEQDHVVEVVSANLKSGPKVLGTDYTGLYNVLPTSFTSPTGAEIVQIEISALSINLSGAFQVGHILNIGGSLPYSGSYLIIATPDTDSVFVASPGIRTAVPPIPDLVYDGTLAPIQAFPIADTTAQDIKDAIDGYYEDSPVVTAELTNTTNPNALIKYPTFYTHGSTIVNNDLPDLQQSSLYHAKRAPFGSIAHIHTYDAVGDKIVALVQNPGAILPTNPETIDTGFPVNYADQECVIVPATAKSLESWMNFTAISPFFIQGAAGRVQSEKNLQISSLNIGSAGAVRVKGVAANSVSSLAKAAPFKVGSSLKVRTDLATAQSLPRDTLLEVRNTLRAPIFRPYRTVPTASALTDAETQSNPRNTEPWFRASTFVNYSRPIPGFGRFVFRKTSSGLSGNETVEITKVTPYIAKLEITAGSGEFLARTGDMLILRGDFAAGDVSYTSIFNSDNQCISSTSDTLNRYIGYPVVHVESQQAIYVIGPNITPETVFARETGFSGPVSITNNGFGIIRISGVTNAANFFVGDSVSISGSAENSYNSTYRVTAVNGPSNYIEVNAAYVSSVSGSVVVSRNTTEFMFIPMLKAEKNIKTTYKSGAYKLSNWKVSTDESTFYRIKDLGNGIGYADFSFSTHDDMQLSGMSVSSEDWIEFSEVFKAENRGRFRIIAHNGQNAFLFKNDAVVDEVISIDETIVDGKIGDPRWRIGPVTDVDFVSTDKRPVRIWDGDSVFENDNILISNPSLGTADWFDTTLIGEHTISKIGLTRDFDLFVEAVIPGATSVSKNVLLSNSISSVKFTESSPYVGYKWCLGYASGESAQSEAEIYMSPSTLSYKISPAYTTQFVATHKLGYRTDNVLGIDGYSYYGGLIAEAHLVIDGSSENPIEYPGVRAAGTSLEVQAPLIRSISLSLQIETRDGVSLNAVKNPVKSAITNYINSLGVAQPVVLSQVIRRVQTVPGVNSVIIINTLPVAEDGVIKIGSYEVPRISSQDDIFI